MKRALGVFTISVAILMASGCDPATIRKAKRTTTQKVADARESADPIIEIVKDQAGKRFNEAKDTVKQKAGEFAEKAREAGAQVKEKAREGMEVAKKKGAELAEKAKPYAEKAKTATTRALDRARRATTQAVEKVKEVVGEKHDDPPGGGESGAARQ